LENIWHKLKEKEKENENENSLEIKKEITIEQEIDLLMNFFYKFPEIDNLSPMHDIVIINNIFNQLYIIFSYVINFFETKCEPNLIVKILKN
jgi:hypothetical protein